MALADPLDTDGTDSLAHFLGLSIEPVLATPADILRAIDQYYGKEAGQLEDFRVDTAAAVLPSTDLVKPSDTDADAPIIKLVHGIIVEAVRRRASDIH